MILSSPSLNHYHQYNLKPYNSNISQQTKDRKPRKKRTTKKPSKSKKDSLNENLKVTNETTNKTQKKIFEVIKVNKK